jgi:hypothetical protein
MAKAAEYLCLARDFCEPMLGHAMQVHFCRYAFSSLWAFCNYYFKKGQRSYRFTWSVVATVVLALPAAIFIYSMNESIKVNGYSTTNHWLLKGEPSVMRWRDIFTLNSRDIQLLSAPEYFKDHLYENRQYSYVGLVHISTFTDCQNYFQPPPKDISTDWKNRNQADFMRSRTKISKILQTLTVNWCIPFALFTIASTIYCLLLSVPSILIPTNKLGIPTAIITLLAAGFYGMIFLNLHRVSNPYFSGYWLPRLIMPPLTIFLILSFVGLETLLKKLPLLQRYSSAIFSTCLAYTAVACVFFVSFLT